MPLSAGDVKHAFDLPEVWLSEVYDWVSTHRLLSAENFSAHGDWPEEDGIAAAFEALDYARTK